MVAATALEGAVSSSEVRLERRNISLARWDAPGFRIAQISDVHLNNTGMRDKALQAVHLAMKQKPDLLVFTGDFLNKAKPECLGYVKEVFDHLGDAGCPCFAVPGNHDYTCEDTGRLFEVIAATPLHLLRNQIAEVHGISIAGLDDAYHGLAQFETTKSSELSVSTLVLLHEPDYVRQVQGTPSLVLSGHSHGGEICLPGGIPIHTPIGASIYKGGYYPDAPTPIYVSRGVGTLGPCRIFCPPEVTLITVNAPQS